MKNEWHGWEWRQKDRLELQCRLEATVIIYIKVYKIMTQESDSGKEKEALDSGGMEAQCEGGESDSEVKCNGEPKRGKKREQDFLKIR